MTFREVLQFEIWSKQTSRKILKAIFICFVVVVIVAVLEVQWITPPERSAARVALAYVEDLQKKNDGSEDEYKARKVKAEAAVEKTQKAAWTLRDEKIANALYGYSTLMEMQHDEPRVRAATREFYKTHTSLSWVKSQKDQEAQQEQQDRMSQQVNTFMHEVLHRALD